MVRLLTVSFFISLVFSLPSALCAQSTPTQTTNQTTTELERYEQAVNATLRTFRDEEKKFISDLFGLVKTGKLPKEVIDRSFLWVRKNRARSRYKFIYFEKVVQLYAAQVKAKIPAFDYSAYTVQGGQTISGATVGGQTFGSNTFGGASIGGTTQGANVSRERSFGSRVFGRK